MWIPTNVYGHGKEVNTSRIRYGKVEGIKLAVMIFHIYAEACKMAVTNLNKCTSSNHASRNFGAVWNMLVPISKWEYITISNDMQIVRSLLCTLVNIVPVRKFAIALLPWPTMYCYGWSTPVIDVWNYRISTIPALKESCSYLKPSKREVSVK